MNAIMLARTSLAALQTAAAAAARKHRDGVKQGNEAGCMPEVQNACLEKEREQRGYLFGS